MMVLGPSVWEPLALCPQSSSRISNGGPWRSPVCGNEACIRIRSEPERRSERAAAGPSAAAMGLSAGHGVPASRLTASLSPRPPCTAGLSATLVEGRAVSLLYDFHEKLLIILFLLILLLSEAQKEH